MSTTQQREAAARALFEHAQRGEYEAFAGIVDPEFVIHSGAEEHRGAEGLAQMVQGYREVLPDLKVTIEHQFSSDEYVATRFTVRGHHEGSLMGEPPTGREVAFGGICLSRFRDGKIAEEWEIADTVSLLAQIGALPEPAAS